VIRSLSVVVSLDIGRVVSIVGIANTSTVVVASTAENSPWGTAVGAASRQFLRQSLPMQIRAFLVLVVVVVVI
jgi:hypothetical protein